MTGFVTKFRMYTSWSFIKTRIVTKIREFFSNLLGFKPRDKYDYFTIGRWMISKRLVYASVIIIGIVSIWYIGSETTLFKHFDDGGVKTYDYDSIRLRTAKGHVKIKAKSGYVAYDGNVEEGYVTGMGKLYNSAGNILYDGNFVQNKYEGAGLLNYPDGNLEYRGDFHDNLFEGSGVLYRENGTKEYEGEFVHGLKNGSGVLYDAGENELYVGTFSSDNIVYSEMLGKSAAEVSEYYRGLTRLYMTDEESVVHMTGIDAMYHGVADPEALDEGETVKEVYVLQDYYNFGTEAIDTIPALKEVMGDPVYEGYSYLILPEAVAVDIINRNSNEFKGVNELKLTQQFTDVAQIDEYDDDYSIYIYTFARGDVLYSFVCTDQNGYFEFYYMTQNSEDA